MRSLAILLLALCGAGCAHPEARREPNKPPPTLVNSLVAAHKVDLATVVRPARSTSAERIAQMSALKFPGFPHPDGSPDPSLGPTWTIDVSDGSIVLFDGTYYSDAYLYLGLPEDVYFIAHEDFADFRIHPQGEIEPNVQIETNASTTKSLLVDCRVNPMSQNQTLTFQFEQSSGWGFPWVNKAIVTPSGGHVFYGISPITWDGGIPTWTYIRLQPTPESSSGGWQFFGCELTFSP